MLSWRFLSLARWRSGLVFAAMVFLLSACGGGGGGDGPGGTLFPGTPAFRGTWQLAVTADGVTSAPVEVTGSDVPTEAEVEDLDAAAVAELVGTTSFQTYTVSVNGTTITITDPDTNYVLAINSIAAANYQDCGNCFVGTNVAFDVSVNITTSGRLDGNTLPAPVTSTIVIRFTYTRIA